MAEPADHWHPGAAYLYVLHLDSPALAWEYLRRHPDYRRDWLRRRRHPEAARHWGLRLLEDPALDARDAHPAWFTDHDSVVQLHPDDDPPPDAVAFDLWRIPGHKQLLYDGRRLVLLTRWPGSHVCLALASGLAHGMAHSSAVRAAAKPRPRCHALAGTLDTLANAAAPVVAQPRPAATTLLELHTLQALDGTLAGASLRRVADVLFGAEDWHADGALRARVRRLVRHGQRLMRGGYRRPAQLPEPEQGRSADRAQRP